MSGILAATVTLLALSGGFGHVGWAQSSKGERTMVARDGRMQPARTSGGLFWLATVAAPPVGPNLLRNADFAQGSASWTLEVQGAAKATNEWLGVTSAPAGLTGRIARFNVTALGEQKWQAQFLQNGLDLREGETYSLSFWGRAPQERPVTVQALVDQDDYHHTGLDQRVVLGPKWRKFLMPFVATRVVPNHTRVSFLLGEALGSLELAGVALRHTPPGVTTPHPLVGVWETRASNPGKRYRFTFNADGTG
jgi:hypothetical protein